MPNLAPGISILGTFNEAGNGISSAEIRSPLRIELVLAIIICMVVLCAGYVSTTDVTPVYVYYLMPVFVVGLWLVYRFQENLLLKKVAEFLRTKQEDERAYA